MENTLKTPLEVTAEALVARDALRLRELTLEWLRHVDEESAWAEPRSSDDRIRIAAAALAELFAARVKAESPAWARSVGAFREPFFALETALRLRSVRELCERESPEPLRRHGVLAPANFLELI